jgi:hypothetical protein
MNFGERGALLQYFQVSNAKSRLLLLEINRITVRDVHLHTQV